MSDVLEARLLLAILGEDWSLASALSSRGTPDAATFLDLARQCDVNGTLHALLSKHRRFDLVGREVEGGLTERRSKCRNDNLLLLARAEQVLDLLLARGIVPVALKGLDVLHRFGIPFDERTLDDVDLLVRPREFRPCLVVLESAGFALPPEPERTHWLRSSYQMPVTSPGPVPVLFEIHWGLSQEGRYDVPVDGLFERAVPLEVAGRQILRLDDHDAVAHHLLHHVQHYFDRRLKWALDLRRIVREPGFEWDRVVRIMTAWGGAAAAGMALRHLGKLFPDLAPREARKQLPAAFWRRALTWPLRSTHPLDWFRGTRTRAVQLYLAAVLLERPSHLPAYLIRRQVRDSTEGTSATERDASEGRQ